MRRSLTPLLLLCALLAALVPAASGLAAEETTFEDLERGVKKALDDQDPEVRASAFEPLVGSKDVRCVDLLIKSVRRLESDLEKVRDEQGKIEKEYEAQFTRKVKADQWFENSARTSKDLDRYNEAVGKIRKKMDQLRLKQRSLENDYTRSQALIDRAVAVTSTVLAALETADLKTGLDAVGAYWRDAKDADTRMRWLDAISDLDRPTVAERIRETVKDENVQVQVRAAALQTLGARRDPVAHDLALKYLGDPTASWDLAAAAVQALRLLHQKASIPPLIEFLKREDLGRLRDDTHKALMSLTGEKHGPYFEPWNRWWEEEHDRFHLPPNPVDTTSSAEAGEGSTFYGIHTFSKRVLFILDISGSMDQVPKGGEGPPRPKIQVARQELLGFILSLDENATFNVIFFNHEVVPWQQKMVEATETAKRRAKKWIESQDPVGGTNIHDALEAGFRMATGGGGSEPVVDTLFFLTDGRPTAGKVQDADAILEEVKEWNRTARLTIHCVGVGDHDQAFMEALARIGGGEYRKR